MTPHEAYDELRTRSRARAVLASCAAVLGWDEQTYMPPKAGALRGEQMAALAGLVHERATDPAVGERLAIAEGSDLARGGDTPEAANLRAWRRDFDRQAKLPRALVESLARATSAAQAAWVAARSARDFARFRPHLRAVLDLKRQEAACLHAGDGPPYDALLDEYEPGATSAALSALFATLRRELVPLVAAVAGARRQPDRSLLSRPFPVDRQRVLGEAVAAAFGFDFGAGRLDPTAHPFCTGIGPGDCRLTTRYDDRDFGRAFFGTLHETGHGLYEQGLDPDAHGTPLGEAASLGVHESQSRLWENGVGRSRAFWAYWFPMARRVFHEALADATLDQFHFAVNAVRPSLIRTEADEVTYNLHVLVRFELEGALLSGDLPVADLPGAWNERHAQTLGIAPAHDGEGCLQDIHWGAGLFGYFPTYTLGNVYGAQLHAAADRDLGGLDALLGRGETAPLREWLRANVHRHGRRYAPAELVRRATGAAPDPAPLVAALRAKYGELYAL
jgi:carboxypeptidase Taq